MVKKREEHSVWYTCEKCHSTFDTYEEAEECENQKPTLQLLRSESYREETEWKIGDFLLIQKEDNLPELVRIVDTIEIYHKIWPRFQYLNYGAKASFEGPDGPVIFKELYNYDSWHTQWVRVVTDDIRDVILEWAEALK